MTPSAAKLQASPDGRYAIRVDEMRDDRGSLHVETRLVEQVTGRDLAWLGNEIDAEFLADGVLRVTRPAWNTEDVLIDAARECFRTRAEQPWLPLGAWSLAESAYRQGWANGLDFRASDPVLRSPWVETAMALGAIAIVALLAWRPWIDVVPRVTLLVIAALVAVLFIYLAASGWRSARRVRDLRPSRH